MDKHVIRHDIMKPLYVIVKINPELNVNNPSFGLISGMKLNHNNDSNIDR